jgi:hypothetical protein
MQNIKTQNYSILGYAFWLVGTKIQVRIYGVHLVKKNDKPRLLLQNIHNHVSDYTVS